MLVATPIYRHHGRLPVATRHLGKGRNLSTFRNSVDSFERLMWVVQVTGKLISSAVPRRSHLMAAVLPHEEHGGN